MTALSRPRVLCVDDEPMVLEGLKRHLGRRFDVSLASGGGAGLVTIDQEAPFAVVVSDMRMPGMDGAAFLARVRATSPDTVRVLLTGHADFSSALAAVNEGQIFRFLVKPCPPETMLATLDAAAEQHRLLHAERELLEQTLTGAVKALSEVLALAHPLAFGRATRLHRTVAALCTRLHVADRWHIEVAAQLSQLGCLQLPAALVEKLHQGLPLTPVEQVQADRVPALADQLLANVPRLGPVREILAAQGRRYDGADDPYAKEKGAGLPLGARLLRLAVDLDTLETSGLGAVQAAAALQGRPGLYDPQLLAVLVEEVASREGAEVLELALWQLKAGMVLAADVTSLAGVLLVARGFTVSQGLLMRLQGLTVGVREPLRVVVGSRP
ncbi:MAG: response regulator [Anaeromyxobacter sp.]|nr:response regulator [Anaeromyxobacter sp.]MBL0276473.1 response regulator [Anaeromyxobacter sp.]